MNFDHEENIMPSPQFAIRFLVICYKAGCVLALVTWYTCIKRMTASLLNQVNSVLKTWGKLFLRLPRSWDVQIKLQNQTSYLHVVIVACTVTISNLKNTLLQFGESS